MAKQERITKQTFSKMVSRWANVAKYEEAASVYINSKHNAWRRIKQLLSDKKLLEKYFFSEGIQIILIDLESAPIEDEQDLKELLLHKCPKTQNLPKTVYFILGADKILIERRSDLLCHLADLKVKNHWSCLLLFNIDFTHPDYWSIISQYNIFLQNTIFHPLYGEEDSLQLVEYLADKWDVKIIQEYKTAIVKECGGILWFVVQAVRSIRDNPKISTKDLFDTTEMQIKVEMTWNRFLKSEQQVLKKLVKNQTNFKPLERHSFNFLRKINFVRKTNAHFEIAVPLLEKLISTFRVTINLELEDDKKIIFNGVNITSNFSAKERSALIALLKSQESTLPRYQLAKAIWKKDVKVYSDWALDQIIARLRKKLSILNIPPKSLKTIKKKGYRFMLNSENVYK